MTTDARARHGRRGWCRVTCGCSVLEVHCVESNEMTTLSPPNCRISLAQSASAARRANALSSGTGRFGSSECNKESNTCVRAAPQMRPSSSEDAAASHTAGRNGCHRDAIVEEHILEEAALLQEKLQQLGTKHLCAKQEP